MNESEFLRNYPDGKITIDIYFYTDNQGNVKLDNKLMKEEINKLKHLYSLVN